MSKVQRHLPKEKLEALTATTKKTKVFAQNNRQSTSKKIKQFSLQDRSKQQKVKSLSTCKKKQTKKTAGQIIKIEKNNSMSSSPHKRSKKQKEMAKKKTNKNQSQEIQRQRKLNHYLKNRFAQWEKEKMTCNESTQFVMPMAHTLDRENVANFEHLLPQGEEYFEQKDISSKIQVTDSYQNLEENHPRQSRIVSLEKWQNIQTLRLKNEQLTNYIEELQKVEQKLANQKRQQQIFLKDQNKLQKEKVLQEYSELQKKHKQVIADNATLQQMLSQRMLDIQTLKHLNTNLNETVNTTKGQLTFLKSNNQRLKNDSMELKHEVQILKKSLTSLSSQHQKTEKKYQACCSQKEKIRRYADEVLIMIKKMQIQREG